MSSPAQKAFVMVPTIGKARRNCLVFTLTKFTQWQQTWKDLGWVQRYHRCGGVVLTGRDQFNECGLPCARGSFGVKREPLGEFPFYFSSGTVRVHSFYIVFPSQELIDATLIPSG